VADAERKDTHPDMEKRARAILLAKTPEERLRMASAMSMGARALAYAGARAQLGPDASDADVRRLVFLRFYGRELGKERAAAIFDAIEARRAARSQPDAP
jgi:hypothetical protein